MFLEAIRQVKMAQPAIYLRCHKNTPDELLEFAVEVNRDYTAGMPAFVNDEPTIFKLISDYGVTLEDAREWIPAGCVGIHVAGCNTQRPGWVTNKFKQFELALHDGVDPGSGKRVGPATGDPRDFKSYEELYKAFMTQVEAQTEVLHRLCRVAWQFKSEVYQLPYASLLTNDCIAKAKDMLAGGIRYPSLRGDFADVGYQNIADSLTALKKLVFEEKTLTMAEVLEALELNFEGKDAIRQMLLRAPKYGNDDDYADDVFNQVCHDVMAVQSTPDLWGKKFYVNRGGTANYFSGMKVGATPDGRKAWEPTADANLSPMRGCDTNGPTAVILSATKMDHMENSLGGVLNMKLMPSLLETKAGISGVVSLIKTHFDRGAWFIQFNIIEPEVLLDAREHPENHKDLLVRVAGFSAYFVELCPTIQDEVIERTLHEAL
jgi:pyruvate-formate lyase